MFWDDVVLVTQMVEKYGLQKPFVDLGGLWGKDITIADYDLTLQDPEHNQMARYVQLRENPFSHIAPGYTVVNPDYGDPTIEELPSRRSDWIGTIVCLSVLEHVENPLEVFSAFAKLLKPGGLLICSTEQSFPIHSAPRDYWRFSDEALKYLSRSANLTVLEAGYRLNIHGGQGILNIQDMQTPQEIRSVYVCASKGTLNEGIQQAYTLPRRYRDGIEV